jgi:hypothetical protein
LRPLHQFSEDMKQTIISYYQTNKSHLFGSWHSISLFEERENPQHTMNRIYTHEPLWEKLDLKQWDICSISYCLSTKKTSLILSYSMNCLFIAHSSYQFN